MVPRRRSGKFGYATAFSPTCENVLPDIVTFTFSIYQIIQAHRIIVNRYETDRDVFRISNPKKCKEAEEKLRLWQNQVRRHLIEPLLDILGVN